MKDKQNQKTQALVIGNRFPISMKMVPFNTSHFQIVGNESAALIWHIKNPTPLELDDFKDSTNSGFYVEADKVLVRLNGETTECRIDGDGNLVGEVPDLVRDLIEQVFISYDYLLTRVEE